MIRRRGRCHPPPSLFVGIREEIRHFFYPIIVLVFTVPPGPSCFVCLVPFPVHSPDDGFGVFLGVGDGDDVGPTFRRLAHGVNGCAIHKALNFGDWKPGARSRAPPALFYTPPICPSLIRSVPLKSLPQKERISTFLSTFSPNSSG